MEKNKASPTEPSCRESSSPRDWRKLSSQGATRKPYTRDCFWNSSWHILAIEPYFPIRKRNDGVSFLRASVSVGVWFRRGINAHRNSFHCFFHNWRLNCMSLHLSLQSGPDAQSFPKLGLFRFAKRNEIIHQLLCQRLRGEKIWLWVSAAGEWLDQAIGSWGYTRWLLANSDCLANGSASD